MRITDKLTLIFLTPDSLWELLQGELNKEADATRDVTLREYINSLEEVGKAHMNTAACHDLTTSSII